ncbi:motility protein A [Methylicorpusculum oleiharenae]|uniref:motility protein A n=1 Tax=Methylicorpusculum oleiharenae TaxID=1338687 RepID=UPI00135A8F17|nr:motility protein A [Methylicorpusculum oleiharenae]MCD2452568.1 motility protein A [Methylicorpusculum oleiharenae]
MDFATIFGPFVAVSAIAIAFVLDEGNPVSLINWPSFILVIGGTLGATMVAYPLKQFVMLPIFFWQNFKTEPLNPQEHIDLFVNLADKARRGGMLALEEELPSIDDPFIRNALMLVIDGVDMDEVRQVLENDNDMTSQRHHVGIAMMSTMAGVAPAMGMIGTVVGLIGVMGHLSDPSQLGPSIAVAFLTTLYGSLMGNLIFSPMANKLKQKDKDEIFIRELIIEGILALQESENPRMIRQKLESFLRPGLRSQN